MILFFLAKNLLPKQMFSLQNRFFFSSEFLLILTQL
jgi:hypothetical protein